MKVAVFCPWVFLSAAVLVSTVPRLSAQAADSAAPPANTPPAATTSAPPPPNTLLDGTPVNLRLSQTISSSDAKVGQEIPFEVIDEVDVDGVPAIAKGATAIGTVTEAEPKRRMGRAGKLNINISYVRLLDNEKAMLRAVKDENGKGHVGAMTGAIVATSIVFFPAAPLFLFMHGKDITIPQGTEITAFVQGDMHLDLARLRGTGAGAETAMAVAPAEANCSLLVSSSPPGADIDIDGAFSGSTPSTLTVGLGSHEIVVKKQGFADWSRKLNVTGGSVHLDATLSPVAGN
ncbi:MAG: PEGA domain-containing protein [Acidobacteriaceae bacterium]